LQAELGDDAVDRTFTDAEVALPEFLRDDLGAGFRVQETMTDHLADNFLGASVLRFGAALGAEKGQAALLEKKRPELEVTLAAITEFGGGPVNAFAAAFALDQHGELTRDFVVFGNGQGAGGALDALLEELEGKHGDLPKGVPKTVYLNMAHITGESQEMKRD
jgi:hypothetical protein